MKIELNQEECALLHGLADQFCKQGGWTQGDLGFLNRIVAKLAGALERSGAFRTPEGWKSKVRIVRGSDGSVARWRM